MAEGSVPSSDTPVDSALPNAPAPRTIGFRLGLPDNATPNLTYVLAEALEQSPNTLMYFVSRELKEMFPERFILETIDHDFDPVKFAYAKHCVFVPQSAPHPHILSDWERDTQKLKRFLIQAWMDMEWDGLRFECVKLRFMNGQRYTNYWALIADEREHAERFFKAVCAWNAELHDEILVYNGNQFEKDPNMFRAIRSAMLETLVLRAGLKEEIYRDTSGFFEGRELYERYGVPWKRGILFIGPPGNGKTHTVKALVNALGQRCIYVKRIVSGYKPGADDIAEVFDQARKSTPCVIVLEDLDSMLTDRNRSQFLNELDGFAGHMGVLTLATTNHPERLDPAILERPSRFDRTYHFDLPGQAERAAYVRAWNESVETDLQLPEVGIAAIADSTEGFSFAYLKELFLSSTMSWMAASGVRPMNRVMCEQVDLLRRQMDRTRATGHEPEEREEADEDEDEEDEDDEDV